MPPIRPWSALFAGSSCALLAWAFLRFASSGQASHIIADYSFWIFLFAAVAWVASLVHFRRGLYRWALRGLPRRFSQWIVLAIAEILILVFVLVHTRGEIQIRYDEPVYLMAASQGLQHHTLAACVQGHFFDGKLNCFQPVLDPHPGLFSFLVSLAYSVAGERLSVVFALNLLLYFFAGLLIFRLCRDLRIGFAGSLFALLAWSVMPMNIIRARSAGPEITCVVFWLLAVSLAHFLIKQSLPRRRDRFAAAVAIGTTAALCAQTRMESPLFALLCLTPLLIRSGPAPYFIGLFLFTPRLAALVFYGAGNPPSLSHWYVNLSDNIHWLFVGDFTEHLGFPFASLAGVVGLVWLHKNYRRHRQYGEMLWPLIFPVALVLYSAFQMGNFPNNGVVLRYVVTFAPVLVIGSAYVFWQLLKMIPPTSRKCGLTIAFGLLIFAGLMKSEVLESREGRGSQWIAQEENLLDHMIEKLPREGIFFSAYGVSLLVSHRATYHYSRLLSMPGPDDPWWQWLSKHSQNQIFYVRGWECWNKHAEDELYQAYAKPSVPLCADIERRFALEEVERQDVSGSYDVILYRIKGFKPGI